MKWCHFSGSEVTSNIRGLKCVSKAISDINDDEQNGGKARYTDGRGAGRCAERRA